jgi:hypothetical protein
MWSRFLGPLPPWPMHSPGALLHLAHPLTWSTHPSDSPLTWSIPHPVHSPLGPFTPLTPSSPRFARSPRPHPLGLFPPNSLTGFTGTPSHYSVHLSPASLDSRAHLVRPSIGSCPYLVPCPAFTGLISSLVSPALTWLTHPIGSLPLLPSLA